MTAVLFSKSTAIKTKLLILEGQQRAYGSEDDGAVVTFSSLVRFQEEEEIRRQRGFICSFFTTRTLFSYSVISVSPAVHANQHQCEAAEWCFLEFIPQHFKDKDLHSTSKRRTTDCGGARELRSPQLRSAVTGLQWTEDGVGCTSPYRQFSVQQQDMKYMRCLCTHRTGGSD